MHSSCRIFYIHKKVSAINCDGGRFIISGGHPQDGIRHFRCLHHEQAAYAGHDNHGSNQKIVNMATCKDSILSESQAFRQLPYPSTTKVQVFFVCFIVCCVSFCGFLGLDCREPVTVTRRGLILVFGWYCLWFSWPGLIRVMRLACYDQSQTAK